MSQILKVDGLNFVSALLLPSHEALSKFLKLYEPQFSHLSNGNNTPSEVNESVNCNNVSSV